MNENGKATARPFRAEDFAHPGKEFAGTPFWSWNGRVTKEKIREQAAYFQEMGMGGAMVHPRTGMDTPYLSDAYMELVRFAAEELESRGMTCWLYDEERFPSGPAGGIVTRDPRFRARYIVLKREAERDPAYLESREAFDRAVAEGGIPKGYYLCGYRVALKDGRLAGYAREETAPNLRAYVELMPESPWFNGQTYLDVFNPEAVDRFLAVTHDRYFSALGERFGKTVPAIFTDEPHMKGKFTMKNPAGRYATVAYTDDMDDSFRAQYGVSLLDVLPEVVYEIPEGFSRFRYWYHEHVTERFAAAYGDRIGRWCAEHGIAYTGHFLSERTLYSQTLALGETMRQYRAQQLPGIDILAGQLELTTVKQAESVRRQMGRAGLVCEMYGVLEWDVRFLQHKLQGDWLAALGVTGRVHHLAYMCMGGEAKRDWPAAIGWQSPWWKEYHFLEDYFTRVNCMLTRGTPVCRVAVLHPIESFWLLFGTNEQTLTRRERMDDQFEQLAQWLLYGLVDYDYLSEAMLPGLCGEGGAPLRVGDCAYDTVIVPPVLTIRKSTLERLNAFADGGGRLLVLGDAPGLVEGAQDQAPQALWAKAERVPMERSALLEALEGDRQVEARDARTGRLSDNLFYQLRREEDSRILFLCHVREETCPKPRTYDVRIRGNWAVERLDALTGVCAPMGGRQENGWTYLSWPCFAQDSLLLRLTEGPIAPPQEQEKPLRTVLRLDTTADFTLDEPNALLLDHGAFALDDGPWQEDTEILRADNRMREAAGLPIRNGDQVQPWLIPEEPARHTAHLRYVFRSEEAFTGLLLAVEQPENATITLNGLPVDSTPVGWYVDPDIKTVALPPVRRGENELRLDVPLTRRTNLEWMYVLGSFGVRVAGRDTTLVKAPESLALDDLTRQRLPFYTGNVTYRFAVTLEKPCESPWLCVPHFASPVIGVWADGEKAGDIAWQPCRVKLPPLGAGTHEIAITAFGSRYNGFGTLHNAHPAYKWYGPDSYRTTGIEWTDNYRLRPSGILSPAELMEEDDG